MGSIPTTLEEGRRWFRFWNSTDEVIPAFGCVWLAGKRFGGKGYSERNLPKDGSPSWDELQKEVGYGNMLLVGRKPYLHFDWGVWNKGGFFFNGATPVPPKSWGRAAADFPTIARISSRQRSGDRTLKIGEGGYYFRPAKDSWDLINASSSEGSAQGLGWGSGLGWGGWGVGNRWSYGSPAVFWCADLIEGFDTTQGLAWVKPGEPPETPRGFRLTIEDIYIADGHNDVPMVPYLPGVTNPLGPTSASDITNESPAWLAFRTPGVYALDIEIGLIGAGGQTASGENPYSQISLGIEPDTSIADRPILNYQVGRVTLAPPVLKQGSYGVESTYVLHYETCRLLVEMVIEQPDDYDPTAENQPVLARIKLDVYRVTNSPFGMSVQLAGSGRGQSLGLNAFEGESSASSVVNP